MSLRNDIMIFSVLGFRSHIRIEIQAPVVYGLYATLFMKFMRFETYQNATSDAPDKPACNRAVSPQHSLLAQTKHGRRSRLWKRLRSPVPLDYCACKD